MRLSHVLLMMVSQSVTAKLVHRYATQGETRKQNGAMSVVQPAHALHYQRELLLEELWKLPGELDAPRVRRILCTLHAD